jgi:hypothetical protein
VALDDALELFIPRVSVPLTTSRKDSVVAPAAAVLLSAVPVERRMCVDATEVTLKLKVAASTLEPAALTDAMVSSLVVPVYLRTLLISAKPEVAERIASSLDFMLEIAAS